MRHVMNVVLAGSLATWIETAPVHAATVEAQTIRQKINLSGRQRMLSQRMSAAACIAMTGLDQGARAAVAQSAHDEFSRTLAGLRDGDEGLGLTAEANAEVRDALDHVEALWTDMSPAVQQLAAGYGDTEILSQITALNTELLRRSNATVQRIVAAYGGSDMSADLAKAIDIAGRQRMLTQRMVKSACFVFVDVGAQDARAELEAAIALFDASLQDLRSGNAAEGIAAPPNATVSGRLQAVSDAWGSFRAQLEALVSGERAGAEDLLALAETGDEVLAKAHQAVLGYVDLAPGG